MIELPASYLVLQLGSTIFPWNRKHVDMMPTLPRKPKHETNYQLSNNKHVQGIVFLLIILLATLGNLLVIVSVLRTKNLRRQKAYYFVVSLAVAGAIKFQIFGLYNQYMVKMLKRNEWNCGMICETLQFLELICEKSQNFFEKCQTQM